MKRQPKEWISDTLILLGAFAFANLYFVLNAPPVDLPNNVKIGLDNLIPRLPIFIVPYLFFLPWLWAVVVYAWWRRRGFVQLALALTITNLVAYVVYLVWQTIVPREVLTTHDIFSGILQFVYDNDLPYAGFPSLHSGLSAVAATYAVCVRSKLSWAYIATAALIVVSTLFTKQHFFLDAVSGVTLGIVVTLAVFRWMPVRAPGGNGTVEH